MFDRVSCRHSFTAASRPYRYKPPDLSGARREHGDKVAVPLDTPDPIALKNITH
jgi:hypothetical protein